jgi:hypothetical protein
MSTYGRTIDAAPGNALCWLNDVEEELLDACVYIERLKMELKNGGTIKT